MAEMIKVIDEAKNSAENNIEIKGSTGDKEDLNEIGSGPSEDGLMDALANFVIGVLPPPPPKPEK